MDDKQLVFSELSLLDLCPNSGEVRDDDDCEEVCLVHWVRQDRGDTDMEGEEVLILRVAAGSSETIQDALLHVLQAFSHIHTGQRLLTY